MALLLIILLLSAAALFHLYPPLRTSSLYLRINLTRIDSKLTNLSKDERSQLAVTRSKNRLAYISSTMSASSLNLSVRYSCGEYIADFAIGTPPQSVTAVLDTGSDLIWTKCQDGSAYNSSASSTYRSLSLGGGTWRFFQQYGSSNIRGTMATESFTFGGTNVSNLDFGCSDLQTGTDTSSSGILGMGRGTLSIISQLDLGKFSYCLSNYEKNLTSSFLLGSLATPNPSSQSTSLIQNANNPTYYYLSLQGITVGSTPLSIPPSTFSISSNGTGGVIIDSGTTYTSLVKEAYDVMKQAFQSQVGLQGMIWENFDLCFLRRLLGSFQPPKLIFHFEGADIDFPQHNYFINLRGGSLWCLAILRSDQPFSIIGNFQQQDMHYVYDLQGGTLSFSLAQCENS